MMRVASRGRQLRSVASLCQSLNGLIRIVSVISSRSSPTTSSRNRTGFQVTVSQRLCPMFSNYWKTGRPALPPGVHVLSRLMVPDNHHQLHVRTRTRRFLSRNPKLAEVSPKSVFFAGPMIRSSQGFLVACVESRVTTKATAQ